MKIFSIMVLAVWVACQTPVRQGAPELLRYFQPQSLSDTLHIEIYTDKVPEGDTIPNRVFFEGIPQQLLQPITHIADSAAATVLSRGFFPLSGQNSAYWVEIRQFWFQHHSLFLYDESKKAFTDRITVAEWYGGDGGQVLIGSWLFDYDGDGTRDIVRIEIQHSLIPTDDEPIEQTDASPSLLLWKNGRFEATQVPDTAAMLGRFPIRNYW